MTIMHINDMGLYQQFTSVQLMEILLATDYLDHHNVEIDDTYDLVADDYTLSETQIDHIYRCI